MRRFVLSAALAFTPVLASAQSPTASQTFAGCDIYACTTFTVRYTTGMLQGRTSYAVTGDGTFTLLAPIVTGAYSQVPLPSFGGPLFSDPEFDDLRYTPSIVLVGHAAGDVIRINLLTVGGNISFRQPVLDLYSFSGTLVGPNYPAVQDRVNILLSPVPEPGTLALAAAGLTLVGGVVRRRRTTTI